MEKSIHLRLLVSCLCIALLLSTHIANAQRHGGGAGAGTATASSGATAPQGGSGAKTSTTSASGGSSVSGFVYKLPFQYHIEYKTISATSTPVYTLRDTTSNCYIFHQVSQFQYKAWRLLLKPTEDNSQLALLSTQGYKVAFGGDTHIQPAVLPLTFDHIYWGSFLYKKDSLSCITLTPNCCKIPLPARVMTSTVKTMVVDTIDRYFARPRGWFGALFGRGRLRVSVTQADSGKLKVQFRDVINTSATALAFNQINFKRYLPTGELSPAVPISSTDSAQNFSLTIRNRGQVRESTNYLSLPYTVLQYGAVTIPFKYRFRNNRPIGGTATPAANTFETGVNAPSEATAGFNVAGFIGYKWGRTQFFYDQTQTHNTVSYMVAAFGGPALFSLTANNTNYGADLNQVASQQIAFSTGTAFTMEWRSVNFGLFYGWDIPVESSPWVYRYKGWIGFGIGFSLGMFTNSGPQGQMSPIQ